MIAALTHAEMGVLELVLGIVLLMWAAWLAARDQALSAVLAGAIGVMFVLLAV